LAKLQHHVRAAQVEVGNVLRVQLVSEIMLKIKDRGSIGGLEVLPLKDSLVEELASRDQLLQILLSTGQHPNVLAKRNQGVVL